MDFNPKINKQDNGDQSSVVSWQGFMVSSIFAFYFILGPCSFWEH